MTSIDLNVTPRVWISGPAGSGKTSAAAACLAGWLRNGVPGERILVLTPQRSLSDPYRRAILAADLPTGSQVDVLTVNSLAQRCIQLYWPLVAEKAGFTGSSTQPIFLTIETAQYHMASVVQPFVTRQGYFAAIQIDPNRLYSQLLDNLNKSALVGFPHTDISNRLKAAWDGPVSQLRVFDQAQDCVNAFRSFCLANNLLDYSLQIELFTCFLWNEPLCRAQLTEKYKYLIYDNLEEDTPAAHDLLQDWLPAFERAILITDDGGGYRRFLGADPVSARAVAANLPAHLTFEPGEDAPAGLRTFSRTLSSVLGQPPEEDAAANPADDWNERVDIATLRLFPEMLDWTAGTLQRLIVDEGLEPGRIAVLAPFLPDTLRFSLTRRLDELSIPYRTVRPSRSLREEPLAQCLLTLAKLAHPHWNMHPHKQDVIFLLMQSIPELDLIRAGILGETVYRQSGGEAYLTGFDSIQEKMKARIGYLAGEKFEVMRAWLADYQALPVAEPDIFFQRAFGELLTRPGFGFLHTTSAGEVTANLMESARKFRQNLQSGGLPEGRWIGREFVQSVEQGLVAAQFLRNYEPADQPAVLIAPAHTYLMQNQAVDVQIWLDIGSNGWWERLEQPLTHPYVLSRSWPPEKKWTKADADLTNSQSLSQMAAGLCARCRQKVYLVYLEINEQGFDQQGPLLKSVYSALTRLQRERDRAA